MSKEEVLEEIAETLTDIRDGLDGINIQLEDISMAIKMMGFFKLIELKPEMKEKLGPLIDELVQSMNLDMTEELEKK